MGVTLAMLKHEPRITKAIIQSGDRSLYYLLVSLRGRELLVVDEKGQGLRSRSKAELQMALEGLTITETVLRHTSAYDEMIGQPPRAGSNTLEVPLANTAIGPAVD